MRILVAEDDTLSRTLLVRVLGDMGHTVTATADGNAAWEAFRKEPFPVVITDWLMPHCDGLELTKRIRTVRARLYPWVIMLTGMDYVENYRATMEAGVDDFLVKPLDTELLRVRLAVAERLQRMGEQVVALTSALPICMHCKSVRDAGDEWKRVEEYFSDIDFSHSYCPECYYDHSLAPEIARLRTDPRWTGRLPATSRDATLDTAVLAALAAFEKEDSPGLVDDLCTGFAESSDALRKDLYGYGAAGLLGGDALVRIRRFAARADDLGLGRLAAALSAIAAVTAERQLEEHVGLANAATSELDVALAALAEACEKPAPAKT